MSYDRVLPNPVPLHYEAPQVRQTSNLLEHKIMNDDVPQFAVMDRHSVNGDSASVQLSPLNQTKVALDKVSSKAPSESPKSVAAPLVIKDLPIRKRSSQSDTSSTSSGTIFSAKSSTESSANSSAKDRESAVNFCLCQPEPKIPRPRNGLANPDISKIIGKQWKALPQETRDEWKDLALEEKARHLQQYPGYRYQPRRSGRDGNSRQTSSGISHNPSGSTVCNRCGGRIMNAPTGPTEPAGPTESPNSPSYPPPIHAPNSNAAPSHIECMVHSSHSRSADPNRPPNPVRIGSNGELQPSRQRRYEENGSGSLSPDSKRRRFNSQPTLKANLHRDKSPESPYPISPYLPSSDSGYSRAMIQMLHNNPRLFRNVTEYPPPDPSLRLPPIKTAVIAPNVMTPVTPFAADGLNLESTVMTIPFLNKIKVLAKISPPLVPSFRDGASPQRGAVIAVDGQDSIHVMNAVDYLYHALQKEGRYNVRVFEGPEIRPRRGSSGSGKMGDTTMDYLDIISAWHRISDDIVSFVRPSLGSPELKPVEEDTCSGVSPKTIIPKTADLHIGSPPQSNENYSESSSPSGTDQYSVPIALVPRYQLTTADTFACSIPIKDAYAPLDHWQWMASLWRACVGPDITVYIRDCEKDELERFGGNPVEVRLQDARTVVVRRAMGSSREAEEKALKRVGFEIEDYLTQ
ncbi:hypothetical protein MW887_011003 [Aspergillus wentii]|nr:hypothetical protein MW887_011003 [Aspergillus wentii]